MSVIIRKEMPADIPCIDAVTIAAFLHAKHSDHTEHFITRALRKSGQLTLSLVAEEGGTLIGHAAVSPVTFPDGAQRWYGLGPVAVAPDRQGKGTGSLLVREILSRLHSFGAEGCVVLGDPAFYSRFGFRVAPSLIYPGVPAEYFMALPFVARLPRGEVSYHSSFAATQ